MDQSNIGEVGIKSIRINGMRVSDLPLGQGNEAVAQLPLVEDTERRNKINGVLKGAPRQTVEYIDARVREARENVERINRLRGTEQARITEYTVLAEQCEKRDEEVGQAADAEAVKAIKARYPIWSAEGLRQQIVQSTQAVEECDKVVAAEYASIAELSEQRGKCVSRDNQLKALGARMAPPGAVTVEVDYGDGEED